jgi:hypothetical protein
MQQRVFFDSREFKCARVCRVGLWSWLVLPLLFAGCGGSELPEVSGKVTLSGAPLTAGRLVFYPTTKGPVGYAQIASDGTFVAQTGSLEGLAAGDYRIAVFPDPAAPGPQIPPQFSDAATSNLTLKVDAAGNSDVELSLK